jgi:hypothetical protein
LESHRLLTIEASRVVIMGRDHDPVSSKVQAGSLSLPSMCAISLLPLLSIPYDGCDLRVPGHVTTSINRAIGICATRHQRLQIGVCLN